MYSMNLELNAEQEALSAAFARFLDQQSSTARVRAEPDERGKRVVAAKRGVGQRQRAVRGENGAALSGVSTGGREAESAVGERQAAVGYVDAAALTGACQEGPTEGVELSRGPAVREGAVGERQGAAVRINPSPLAGAAI